MRAECFKRALRYQQVVDEIPHIDNVICVAILRGKSIENKSEKHSIPGEDSGLDIAAGESQMALGVRSLLILEREEYVSWVSTP